MARRLAPARRGISCPWREWDVSETKPTDVSKMSFEEALAELEQIVRNLEGGQQKLEDAITAYERGAALRKHCEARLAEAEARVAAIVRDADGAVTATRPLT